MRSVDMNIFQDESATNHAYNGKNKKASNTISQKASMMNTNEEASIVKEGNQNPRNRSKIPERWQFTSEETSEEESVKSEKDKKYVENEEIENRKAEGRRTETEERIEHIEKSSSSKADQKGKFKMEEFIKSTKAAQIPEEIVMTPEAQSEFYEGCSRSFKSKRDGIVELKNPAGSRVNMLIQSAGLVNLCPTNIHVYVYSDAEVTCKMKESKAVSNGIAGSDEKANGRIFYGNEICIVGGTLVEEFMLPPFSNYSVLENGMAILLPGTNRCYVFHSMEKEKEIMMNLNISWVEESAEA